jgi:hypothetical protein
MREYQSDNTEGVPTYSIIVTNTGIAAAKVPTTQLIWNGRAWPSAWELLAASAPN